MKTNEIISSLPGDAQSEVFEVLKWFSGCFISFANGKYVVSVGCALLDKYPQDFKSIGYLKNTDVYTNDEINYFAKQM